MNTTLATQESKTVGWLDRPDVRRRIGAALCGWLADDEFVAQLTIAFQDPKITNCTDDSKFKAAHLCASLQLLPSLQQVALIPRKSKNGPLECHVMPQWQGFKALMERHDEILEVNYGIVFEGEEYSYDEHGRFRHRYDPFGDYRNANKDLSNIRGGYLTVRYRDMTRPPKFHFCNVAKIKKARACAMTRDFWDRWPDEMAIKTVYRDGYARRVVPIDSHGGGRRLAELVDLEDKVMGNNPSRPQLSTINDRPTESPATSRLMAAAARESLEQMADEHRESVVADSEELSLWGQELQSLMTADRVRERLGERGAAITDYEMFADFELLAQKRIDQLAEREDDV